MSDETVNQLSLFPQPPEADRPWREQTFVGFDTETTGRYPLSAEICEMAAVKWRDGQVIESFVTLLKPTRPMGDEVIRIHGITNEMVVTAPRIGEKIEAFHDFIQDAIPVAHHAPFDLGFIAIEFEKAGLPLPKKPVLCTSLMSRKLFPESHNHRLQTLIPFFSIPQGTAHRALDDAAACLEVGIRCLRKTGDDALLARAFEAQGGPLTWERFSMRAREENPVHANLIRAVREERIVEMAYGAGSRPGEKRRVHPLGVVRSLDGDFLVAYAEQDQQSKRYYLDKILSADLV